MCTLILGRDVVAEHSVLLAANRDEDPARPSDPPRVLRESPRLVGGRDARAGGTWLAVRECCAVVAVLNRRDRAPARAAARHDRRSRGALVLEVAGVDAREPTLAGSAAEGHEITECLRGASGDGLARVAACRALASLRDAPCAPCTLVFAAPEACWLIAVEEDAAPRIEPLSRGWHVITHADLDDLGEPRTAALLGELAGFAPRSVEQAEQRIDELLRSHGDAAKERPPVCLHEGRMVTVSASSVWLAAGEARYRHAEGRPCEHPLADHSHLLLGRDSAAAGT